MTDDTRRPRPDDGTDEDGAHPVPPGALVVGIDGSVPGNEALAWAVTEATRRSLPLHLLSARETYIGAAHLDSSVAWTDPTLDALDSSSEIIDEARRYVRRLAPDLAVTWSRPWGRPAQHLVDASRDASLVVVGSRGQGRVAAVVLGTVSLQTAAHAHCPVVVVRSGHRAHPAGSLKITVGFDGSRDSAAALGYALDIAGPGGSVDVVLAWWLEVVDGTVVTTPGSAGWEAVEAKYRAMIDRALADVAGDHPEVHVETHVTRGRTEDVLLAAADDADLLVVGSRGRGGFAGLVLGSVSQHLLETAPCPVVVTPRTEAD